jgi:LacI family transcriptional regulator
MLSRLKDIARETGYSINTVSLALRDSNRVTEATRSRILEVAKRVNYIPNNVARSLVKQQTRTVGVILTDITSPILTAVAHHIERLLANLDYAMVLITTEQNLEREKRALDVLRAQQVDGILIFPARHDQLSHIKPLQEAAYPVVLLAGSSTAAYDLITMDDTLGAYKAVRYLIKLGHQRIALLSGGIEKLAGYKQALEAHHIPVDPALIIEPGGSDYEQGYRAAPALFQVKPPPTALLAATDYLALGAIAWCKANHIKIPEQLAVIGFDDIEAAKYSDPGLSSVTYDAALISKRAVSRLMELISQPRLQTQPQTQSRSKSPRTEKTIIEPELAIRQSSGAGLKN